MGTRDSANDAAKVGAVAEAPTEEVKDNTMAMFIMAGMVVSSAGFVMYTRQADSLLKRMSSSSKIQGLTNASYRTKPKSKSKLIILKSSSSESNSKAKIFHEKDDFF